VYLDHAAATPLQPAVRAVMQTAEATYPANPSAVHKEGVAARHAIETARDRLALTLGIRPAGIVFTASGTESNNLAIIGSVHARHKAGVTYTNMEVLTTKLEHPSVSEAVSHLVSLGVKVQYLAVDSCGRVRLDSLRSLLSPKTVLISLAYVNSEIGTIQPLGKLARAIRAYEKETGVQIVLHADGAQAPFWLPCAMSKVPVDILTLDAGKCGGPKGVGVLAARHGVALTPILFGGPQESGLRPATENTPGILGATEAIVLAQERYELTAKLVASLRDELLNALLKCSGVILNGGRKDRIANNINISVPGLDSEFLVISLDVVGIACSTKSACAGGSGGGSAVVQAITGNAAAATSTLRLTLGPATTKADIAFATKQIIAAIMKLQVQQSKLTAQKINA